MRRVISILVGVGVLAGCASVNKQCFGDGVCRTETNNTVTWEGPPEEVAKYQAKEAAEKKAAAERDAAFANAERRPATEPVRIAIIGPSVASPDLQQFAAAYTAMFNQAMQGDARVQVVPASSIGHLLQEKSGSRFGRGGGSAVSLDEALARRVRDGSADVDVLVVVTAKEKAKSGVVSGKGGAGMAQVVNVEFSARLSPVYAFKERSGNEVGKSNTGLAVAGIDKKGEAKSGELKARRNPEQDRAAVTQLAQWVKRTSSDLAAAELPSLTALAEINKDLAASRQAQMKDALQQMMGGKK